MNNKDSRKEILQASPEEFYNNKAILIHAIGNELFKLGQSTSRFINSGNFNTNQAKDILSNPFAINRRSFLSTSIISKDKTGRRMGAGYCFILNGDHKDIICTAPYDIATDLSSDYGKSKIEYEEILTPEHILSNTKNPSYNEITIKGKTLKPTGIGIFCQKNGSKMISKRKYAELKKISEKFNLPIIYINTQEDYSNFFTKESIKNNDDSIEIIKNGTRYTYYYFGEDTLNHIEVSRAKEDDIHIPYPDELEDNIKDMEKYGISKIKTGKIRNFYNDNFRQKILDKNRKTIGFKFRLLPMDVTYSLNFKDRKFTLFNNETEQRRKMSNLEVRFIINVFLGILEQHDKIILKDLLFDRNYFDMKN